MLRCILTRERKLLVQSSKETLGELKIDRGANQEQLLFYTLEREVAVDNNYRWPDTSSHKHCVPEGEYLIIPPSFTSAEQPSFKVCYNQELQRIETVMEWREEQVEEQGKFCALNSIAFIPNNNDYNTLLKRKSFTNPGGLYIHMGYQSSQSAGCILITDIRRSVKGSLRAYNDFFSVVKDLNYPIRLTIRTR